MEKNIVVSLFSCASLKESRGVSTNTILVWIYCFGTFVFNEHLAYIRSFYILHPNYYKIQSFSLVPTICVIPM